MSEINVYIANLGKYNEGELVGAWFTPPIDLEVVKEQIGLNNEYEEYAIHDYESPLPIQEYTSISEINRMAELIDEIEEPAILDCLQEVIDTWFSSLEDLVEHQQDIHIYSDCSSMEDIAYFIIQESGSLDEIPSYLHNYIDYKAYGRDLEINGNFLETNHGIMEYNG